MSDSAIIVDNVSKRFRLGKTGGPDYHRLSEAFSGAAHAAKRRVASLFQTHQTDASPQTRSTRDFWALKDVSFDVKRGEVLGIIGRNGAGKSTLLKILSRITEPTSGRFGVRGRVASLLEVGTGFHPELTGRENIFVSGLTLGMTRAEVKESFDEIVDFSGVETFLDTPVKRYSSGMQVRLGFAVAAHLRSEILIIDEVLAVGDAEFQSKCIGKMQEVASGGRTVLLVTHALQNVDRLCDRAIAFEYGQVVRFGDPQDVIQYYKRSATSIKPRKLVSSDSTKQYHAQLLGIELVNGEGEPINEIRMGQSFTILASIQGRLSDAHISFMLGNESHQQILRGHTWENSRQKIAINGKVKIRCEFRNLPLCHGSYKVHSWIGQRGDTAEFIENVASITIVAADVHGSGHITERPMTMAFCKVSWRVEPAEPQKLTGTGNDALC